MSSIEYVRSSEKYAKSYGRTVDIVARERKYLASTKGFPENSTADFVMMIEKNNLAQFYAINDGEVIGWCDILSKGHEGLNHVGVLGMGLLSEYRHQGIGRKLLHLAINHATKYNNIEKVELEVFKSNANAIELYKKEGFIIEGERVKARKIDDVYDNIILMGKEI